MKETFLINGLVVSSFPMSWRLASVVMTLSTPSGRPARLASYGESGIRPRSSRYCENEEDPPP